MSIVHLSKENFTKEVLESSIPVLVDFWAEWCGPCSMLAPTIEELASDYQGRFKVCKYNVEEGSEIPRNYAVNAIPALFFFEKGKVLGKVEGVRPKEDFAKIMDGIINK